MIRDAADSARGWRKVSELLLAIERIVQTNLVMDTRTQPFRVPQEAAEAEHEIAKLAGVVERELDRLTSEKLRLDLQRQRLSGKVPVRRQQSA